MPFDASSFPRSPLFQWYVEDDQRCASHSWPGINTLIQARFVNRTADSAERIEPPLSTLTLVEEVPDGLFDQFTGALVVAASKFLLDLLCQIRR
jgi:hypothetical protein